MTDQQNETPEKPAGTSSRSRTPRSTESTTPRSTESTSGAGNATTQQATAAVSSAVGEMRARLVTGEQIILVAAAVIVAIVYVIFDFLLDYFVVSDFAVLVAVLAVLAIWVHRWGHYDFGNAYRIIVGALGISLAVFAVLSLLAWVRVGGDSVDFLHLLARLIYWISGIAAGYGAWLVFRQRTV